MTPSSRRISWIGCLFVAALCVAGKAAAAPSTVPLFSPVEVRNAAPEYLADERKQWIRITDVGYKALKTTESSLELRLFDGESVVVKPSDLVTNRSGSTSWIGKVNGQPAAPVVLVSREGVLIGSIRTQSALYMVAYAGSDGLHLLYEVDESLPKYQEQEPTAISADDPRLQQAKLQLEQRKLGGPQDDGSIQDLMVVYTPRAVTEVGGVVAMENLIDLGVTETNMSYETSGVNHRIRLVHTGETDYDENSGMGCPRDLLQDPTDGVMDEVHGIRDNVAADLVKLIVANGGGCGRAFIMNDVSVAFEEFAFCFTNHVCVSPGYTFQHELGHIQSGRHQRTGPVDDSPFPFNHGYTDPVNEFRTIMAAGSSECPNGCPRRLAWSNPDVLDDETGQPMGIPEGDPEAADNRKTLNATAWVVANFRVSSAGIFADGFESGDLSAWE